MKIIKVTDNMMTIMLGRRGENEHTQIWFDVSDWMEEYPDATILLINQLPYSSEEYPVVTSQPENGIVKWTVGGAELNVEGYGQCTLEAVEGNVIAKKHIWRTKILPAMGEPGEAPEAWESWMTEFARMVGEANDAMEDAEAWAIGTDDTDHPAHENSAKDHAEAAKAAQEAAEEAREAIENLGVSANTLAAGSSATAVKTVDPETGAVSIEFGIPKGDKGDTGATGPKGDTGYPTDAQVMDAVDDWLEDHPEVTTTVQDGSLTMAKFSNDLKIQTENDFVTPEMFGAVGDGETDDAEAIQTAVDYCILNHKKLKFQTKTYGVIPYQEDKSVFLYSATKHAIIIKGSIDIDLNGCTIQVLENDVVEYCVIYIDNSDGVILKNGTIIGDRAYLETVTNDNSKLLTICDSKNVNVDGLVMKDSKGDCMTITGVQKTQPYTTRQFSDFYMGIIVQNCVMSHSVRHGMTVSKGRGVTFYNCRIENNRPEGLISYDGNAIDMEPYFGYGSIFDFRFESCSMTDNAGSPFFQMGDGIRLENCYLQGVNYRKATNCMLSDSMILGGIYADGTGLTVDNCNIAGDIYIRNTTNTYNQLGILADYILRNNNCYFIRFESITQSNKIGDLIIQGNTIKSNNAYIAVLGKSDAEVITGQCIIDNNKIIRISDSSDATNLRMIQLGNIKDAILMNNVVMYDVKSTHMTANVFDIGNMQSVKLIRNIVQRKYEQAEMEYSSLIMTIIKLTDVGKTIISENHFNPDNTVFSTQTLSLITATATDEALDIIFFDNYLFDVNQITSTPSAVNVLLDNNNVWDNTAPYSTATGVSF